jgi:beta-lactamase regulating signal transducer with metallopeptidase domain
MREALIDYLVNAAWQLPLIAAGAWALGRVLTPSAARRAWLWSGFLGLALVLPLRLHPIASPVGGAQAADATLPALASAPPAVLDAAPAAASPAWHAPALSIDPQVAQVALLIAAGAALVALIRLGIGLLAARRLVRGSQPATLAGPLAEALARFCARHGLRKPQVRVSAALGSPVTVGALDPVILLPAGFSRLPLEEARAAVLHEAAHIQRGDYGANLICEVAALPLAWHPALYPLKAGLRQAREAACDALAAREMASPAAYAECLVALARKAIPAPPAMAALAMFGEGPLEGRVKALLAARPGRFSSLRNGAASVLVLAGVAAPALLLHVTPSLAETREVTRLAQVAEAPLPPVPPSAPAAPAARPARPAPPAPPAAPAAVEDSQQVIINAHGKHYRHSWIMPDGHRLTVYTSDAREPTPEEQRHIERQLADARVQVERAKVQVEQARRQVEAEVARSHVEIERARQQIAEARVRIQGQDMAAVQRALDQAEARLNDPEMQRRIEHAREELKSGKVREKLDKAAAALADPEHHKAIIIDGDVDDPN